MSIPEQFSVMDRVLLTGSILAVTWSLLAPAPEVPPPEVFATCTTAPITAADSIPGQDGLPVKRLPPCAVKP